MSRKAARTPLSSRILAPLAVDEFLAGHFEKTSLHLKGKPGKFDFLFRAADFGHAVARASKIRAVFGGGRWQADIRHREIEDMIAAGATVCVSGMEAAYPALGKACAAIKRELGYGGNVSVRAYASPRGGGFDTHYDARASTTLQIAGRKRWWYSEQPAEDFPLRNSIDHAEGGRRHAPPPLRRMKSVVLEPGDVLSLPAGAWHRARALERCLALNLAFDHVGASAAEIVMELLRQRLRTQAALRPPLRLGTAPSAERRARIRDCLDQIGAELARLRGDERRLEAVCQAVLQRL